MSNLKQIGLGIMQYVQDYDETYPYGFNQPYASRMWWDEVQPYVKSTQIFQCSSGYTGVVANGNYGANTHILTMNYTTGPVAAVKLAEIQLAAENYLVMDYGTYYASASNVGTASGSNWEYLPGMGEGGATCNVTTFASWDRVKDCRSGRHFGGVNMAFADGHAKWLKSSVVVEEAKKSLTTSAWYRTKTS